MNVAFEYIQLGYNTAAASPAFIYFSDVIQPLSERVSNVFSQYAPTFTGTARWVSGFRDVNTGLEERENLVNQPSTPRKTARKLQNARAYMFRGVLLYGSAVFTMTATIYKAQHSELHAGYYMTKNLGSLFFIFANAITLHQSVQQYYEGRALVDQSLSISEKDRGKLILWSAQLGVVNSFANMCASSLTIMNSATALIVLISSVAIVTGIIKPVYDYRSKEQMATPRRPINPAVRRNLFGNETQ